ncbi:AsnC family transcriptional regulator [Paracoccus marinaquae]|uniref:Lrp/AsnC family transcriptional regulator n=1 Tax=Paracoccus marinaquae TaxID=2841926 RepID=A0ABS6ALG0_9RHOB|nr:Lrp/AsnC family transcriptional regulator [Paracoccus marinaquae]MBU3030489.1 Lrp/AsnC family transcriptional regulator [Paracoccus marinaquae]
MSKPELDRIDRKILRELMHDATLSTTAWPISIQ